MAFQATAYPLLLLAGLLTLGGCAYRFTNSAQTLAVSKKSVAIEGIFDTTRQTLAHDILWRALQKSFAGTGKLRLLPAESADVLIRVHLNDLSLNPSAGNLNDEAIDPVNPYSGETLAPTAALPTLNSSPDSHSLSETLKFQFLVEAWDLQSGQKLFAKSYKDSFSYAVAEAAHLRRATLASKENIETKLAQSAETLARTVYLDLLARL